MILMSIAILGAKPTAELVSAVRTITGASISEIATAISEERPVYVKEFHSRPVEQTFQEMREILGALEALGVRLRVRQNAREIPPQILRNLISSSEESREQMCQLDDFGHS